MARFEVFLRIAPAEPKLTGTTTKAYAPQIQLYVRIASKHRRKPVDRLSRSDLTISPGLLQGVTLMKRYRFNTKNYDKPTGKQYIFWQAISRRNCKCGSCPFHLVSVVTTPCKMKSHCNSQLNCNEKIRRCQQQKKLSLVTYVNEMFEMPVYCTASVLATIQSEIAELRQSVKQLSIAVSNQKATINNL